MEHSEDNKVLLTSPTVSIVHHSISRTMSLL